MQSNTDTRKKTKSNTTKSEIVELLKTIKSLSERQETLITLLEHRMNSHRHGDKFVRHSTNKDINRRSRKPVNRRPNKPVNSRSNKPDLADMGIIEKVTDPYLYRDLYEAKRRGEHIRTFINPGNWKYMDPSKTSQYLGTFQGFLTAFQIEGLGYSDEGNNIDNFIRDRSKPSANLQDLCSVILCWGIHRDSTDQAKRQLGCETVQDKWGKNTINAVPSSTELDIRDYNLYYKIDDGDTLGERVPYPVNCSSTTNWCV